MANVEHLTLGFQWADPTQADGNLEVSEVGPELQIRGFLPDYSKEASTDIILSFERAPKSCPIGQPNTSKEAPDVLFANADSDEKLINFVRRFGPVVAKYSRLELPTSDGELGELRPRAGLVAAQDVQELRNEQLIYCAATRLAILARNPKREQEAATRTLIREIASRIGNWPQQWERERSQRHAGEPSWRIRPESLKRIEGLSVAAPAPNPLGLSFSDGRIVICELLNSFPGAVFPNPFEMHSTIKFGIRPLLYSILRRQFMALRDIARCANTRCRDFFNVERVGQEFCSPQCSRQQRQRTYWSEQGKKLRKKRRSKKKNVLRIKSTASVRP
jgi:hypothetical protein